jgi:hypothetical protein
MIKKFVLNYIRSHMDHSWAEDRADILRAVNEGMASAFREDSIPSRISWTVGELVDNDPQYCDKNAPMVLECISGEMLFRTTRKVTGNTYIRL